VQLGEHQVKRVRWPLVLGALAVTAVAVLAVAKFSDFRFPAATTPQVVGESEIHAAVMPATMPDSPVGSPGSEVDMAWLDDQQQVVWQGLAELWRQPGAGLTIQAACQGDNSLGYACLQDQGNWLKINRLGLPTLLVLPGDTPSYILLQGMDGNRLLVGTSDQLRTVSKKSVESLWLGTYLIAWPQAAGWPQYIGRGGLGPAVATIMEMAARVDDPYNGEQVFDATFELWLKGFQIRNGLEADGIVGRNTLLQLMTASIDEPKLLRTWE